MPSSLRAPKTLAEWLELDYFQRARRFRRLWTWLPLTALVVSLLGVGWTFLPGQQTAYEAAPLSTAHAMFSQDCHQCHTRAFATAGRLWQNDPVARSVPDEACTRCHAGSIHHVTQIENRSCASCHHEHRGHAALARVPDEHCTSCHANLTRNDGQPPEYAAHVTGFTDDRHPEFRLWLTGTPKDPGHIHFNHKVHLAPEGVLDIDRNQQTAQQEQVKVLHGDSCGVPPVKMRTHLECQSCHQLDASGRDMQPISYERHCQQCHPLSVQLVGNFQHNEKAASLACTFSKEPVPHPSRRGRDTRTAEADETPEVVRAVLRDRLTRFILANNDTFLSGQTATEPARLIPGMHRPDPVTRQQWDWVTQQLGQQEHLLFDGGGGCRYCHEEKTDPQQRPNGLPEYYLSDIPERWYNHAVFRHQSHQMLVCAECHGDVAASTTATDVLLPRRATCQRCHNPQVKARSDCVECHTYHDPLKQREFRGTLDIGTCTRR